MSEQKGAIRPLRGERSSVFFRFPAEADMIAALDEVCRREFIGVGVFGRQAVHNELIRRGYLRGALVGADGMIQRKTKIKRERDPNERELTDATQRACVDDSLEQHKETSDEPETIPDVKEEAPF